MPDVISFTPGMEYPSAQIFIWNRSYEIKIRLNKQCFPLVMFIDANG